MANPSIVNATAVGKEVIRRSYLNGAGASETTLIAGAAEHVYTIISIIICEMGSRSDGKFSLYVDVDNSGTNIYFADNLALPSKGIFIWNDRFAITATDKLHFLSSSASTPEYDVWCTYIDQQFAAP